VFSKQTIYDYDIGGKKVLVRADYNVPLDKEGKITSNFRIKQSIPTLNALIDKGCKIVICSHLGRPKGPDDKSCSLKPVAKELSKLLKKDIVFVSDCVGDNVRKATSEMSPGDIVLLENVRFHPEEEKNDEDFARGIIASTGAEVFVQDGFGVVHRAHATTDAIARQLPALAGLLLEREVDTITNVMQDPKRPLLAIIGGAKIADKIEIIYKFIDIADGLVIGGAMANTFLKAQGVRVGESLVDDDDLDTARDIMKRVRSVMKERNFTFYLPQDGVVSTEIDNKTKTRIVDWDTHDIAEIEAYPAKPKADSMKVKANEKILDIGPYSGAFISGIIQTMSTVVWNGTMGVSELDALHGSIGPFAHGTEAVIDALLGKYGNIPFSLIGGGDTSGYIEDRKLTDMFSHVSTGGGASLELMAGKELPGVAVLWNK